MHTRVYMGFMRVSCACFMHTRAFLPTRCTCRNTRVHMYAHTSTATCARVGLHTHACTSAHTRVHVRLHTQGGVLACARLCTHVWMHVPVHTDSCSYLQVSTWVPTCPGVCLCVYARVRARSPAPRGTGQVPAACQAPSRRG